MNLCCPGEVLIIDTLGRERHDLISSNAVAKAVNWNRSTPAGVITGVKGAVRRLSGLRYWMAWRFTTRWN